MSTFCPWTLLGVSRLRLHNIDKRIKISSDPAVTTVDMTTTVVVGVAHFPESSGYIYFRRPETPLPLHVLLGLGNPVRFHTFSFPYEKFSRNNKARLRLYIRWKGFHRESFSKWHSSKVSSQFWFQNSTV